MKITNATAAHAAEIAAIYNDAVAHTTAIWNDTTVDRHNRAAWIAERQGQGFPVLVALDAEGAVLGYATYGPFRPHDGYRHTAELSIYVQAARRGLGTGRQLLQALIDRARTDRLHVLIAGIEAGNTVSIALHTKLGFREAGTLRQVGTKFGRWLDLVFLELVLPQPD